MAVWIRFVLVPGLTDGPEQIAEVADLATDFGDIVERVEVLPYHRLGVDKYAALGRAYPLLGTPAPSQESVDEALAIFRERGLYALAWILRRAPPVRAVEASTMIRAGCGLSSLRNPHGSTLAEVVAAARLSLLAATSSGADPEGRPARMSWVVSGPRPPGSTGSSRPNATSPGSRS